MAFILLSKGSGFRAVADAMSKNLGRKIYYQTI